MKTILLLEYKEIQAIESALIHYMRNMEFDERFTTMEEAREIEREYSTILERVQNLKFRFKIKNETREVIQ